MFERIGKLERLKNSWVLTNRLYLLPLIGGLTVADAALGFWSIVLVLVMYGVNIFRARLPIDPGGEYKPETFGYKKTGIGELKLDLYRPSGGGEGAGTVFFAHGGGWISGFRNQPNNVSWCRFLASRGFNVVSIDYRFGFRFTMEDILEDYADGLWFIRENAGDLGIGREKIILMGLSAGGHLALSYAAFHSARENREALEGVKGVVAYYAPSDLRDLFLEEENKSLFVRFAAASTLKTLPQVDGETYEHYSPITWFTPRMVPVMAVHARKDQIVPFRSSFKMIKRLKELKVPCRFLVHKTGGHCFEVKEKDYRTTRILEETVRFMRGVG